MDNQILAYLSGKMGKEHETIATEGLVYLLDNSDLARQGISNLARSAQCILPPIQHYRSEVAGENFERPDVVGFSEEGKELVIIEGKFDAGLTDNQPNSYIDRLCQENPGILIFVVPEKRIPYLWSTIIERAAKACDLSGERELPDGLKTVNIRDNHRLVMLSWHGLLNQLLLPAQRKADPIVNDILQLMSLCERIEGQQFLPFLSEEITSTSMARRHLGLDGIVDAIVGKLLANGQISVDGQGSGRSRDGYWRYFMFGDDFATSGASISLDYKTWLETELSPIWLYCGGDPVSLLRPHFQSVASRRNYKLIDEGSSIMLPIIIKPGEEQLEIVNHGVELASDLREFVVK